MQAISINAIFQDIVHLLTASFTALIRDCGVASLALGLKETFLPVIPIALAARYAALDGEEEHSTGIIGGESEREQGTAEVDVLSASLLLNILSPNFVLRPP